MRMGLLQRMAQPCALCKCERPSDDDRLVTVVDVWLNGARPYQICPRCRQEVPEWARTAAYRAAWRSCRRLFRRDGRLP
jgi:hypothetical protein